MTRLANSITEINDHYTVVVVGSGYGGGIAASRLARAGQTVCVLERGKEFQPGEYPDTLPEAAREMQADGPVGHVGSRTGLYDFRVNEDLNVFVGCGLGGTSLVNANVSLRAVPRVLEDPRWPQAFRDDVAGRLEEAYGRAEAMLKPNPYPDGAPALPKLEALEAAATHPEDRFYRTPINVNFDVAGPNHVGVEQQPCNYCGDCVSGCNHRAKNTTLMNYLPDARNHGAEIYTQVFVRRIERKEDGWLVHYQLLRSGREKFDAPTMFVSADVVVLAAGTLGSTEILLRSKANGLPVSDRLGERFTGNGDVLGFGYNTDREIRGIGYGHLNPKEMDPVGPCITGVIDARERERLDDGWVIEEGVVPGALSAIFPGTMAIAAALMGKDTDSGLKDYADEKKRQLQSMLYGAYAGAARNTQTYLVMTHDDAAGRMTLEDDRLRIAWPGVGAQPIFERVSDRLQEVTAVLGGTYVKNPIWNALMKHDLVTVHPLGGCVMAEDGSGGVTNHKGQVFSGAGDDVHDGLYVADGAVIPRSLGVNPLLTISAVAERTCALLAEDRGWTIDYALPSAPPAAAVPAGEHIGIQFTETMRGKFSTAVKDDYAKGEELGEKFEFTLTIMSDHLDALIDDPSHQAKIVGTVDAPALSADPLMVTDGRFNLLVEERDEVMTRRMEYRMTMTTEEGRSYFFEGHKVVRDDEGLDLWSDTSTLYITVYDGETEDAPVLGKGILHIKPTDFARQISTLEVLNADSLDERLAATAKFGAFFAGALYEVYGGIFRKAHAMAPDPPPRKKRPLRLEPPETHFVATPDGATIRLMRYQGGSKGPVLLAPGFGTSTLAFRLDTIETSLAEYLFAEDYDVWLLDYRASPDLPTSRTQFTLDDIALYDYPAAVARVKTVTGARDVQVMGHCVASVTLLMSLLHGLQGVRTAICSQFTVHVEQPWTQQLKAWSRTADLLEKAGVDYLTTDYDASADIIDKLADKALRLYPTKEQCDNPVCRRILFMYGEVFKHSQLNALTHDVIHELFGIGNMRSFQHLTTMIRKHLAVDHDGNDVYLPHVDRLGDTRIALLQGQENGIFSPKGSEKTYEWLCDARGPALNARHVVEHYGHMDFFIGRNASDDIFPIILRELETGN